MFAADLSKHIADTLLRCHQVSMCPYVSFEDRTDPYSVSGHRLSTAEVESALILHKGVAETAVVGAADEITGQAVYAFVTMKPEFDLKNTKEADLGKELANQVRKVIGPFAAPKKIVSLQSASSVLGAWLNRGGSTWSRTCQRLGPERL